MQPKAKKNWNVLKCKNIVANAVKCGHDLIVLDRANFVIA